MGKHEDTYTLDDLGGTAPLAEEEAMVSFTDGKTKPGHLWQRLFTVVLAPFVLLAIPSHLLFMKSGHRASKSAGAWLKSIFIPVHIGPIILSVATLFTTALATASVLYWIFIIFYSLIIQGEVNFDILDAFYNLIQSAPLYLPTMAIWLYGFSMKNQLLGYDTAQFELEKLVESCSSEKTVPKYYSSKNLLVRAFCLYFLIGSVVIVTMVLDFTRFRLPRSMPYWIDMDYWYGLWVLLSYNCVLATYCMICWGLQCQLQLFSTYLTYLVVDGREPTFKILSEVKFYFKKAAEQISFVNASCSMLVSAVVVILLCFVVLNTAFVIFYAVPSSVTIIITLVEQYLQHFGLDVDITSPWERYSHRLDDNGTKTEGPSLLDKYGPMFVRKTVAYIFLVGAQLGLIFFVGLQAIRVNTSMRYFSVQFNDYMSSHAGSISLDLYNEFRTVRFYILSALNFPGKWITLRIPIMNHIPIIKNKIHRTGAT